MYLRESRDPSVRNGIAQFLLDPALYERALQELQRKYGRPYVISSAYILSIRNLPTVKDNNLKSPNNYVAELIVAVGALIVGGCREELATWTLIDDALYKLPLKYRTSWGQQFYKFHNTGAYASLEDYARWIERLPLKCW